ncbi:MAG: VOC family protein [Acidimicrobiales bacterium]
MSRARTNRPSPWQHPPIPTESVVIIFRVEDCRRTFEFLNERGAEFLTQPVDRGAEIRAFFRDPDGHLFEISALT